MSDLFPPSPDAAWFQCPTPTCDPHLVIAVEPCDPPEGEMFYVGTRLVQETLYRFYRKAFIRQGDRVEFWAQVREDDVA